MDGTTGSYCLNSLWQVLGACSMQRQVHALKQVDGWSQSGKGTGHPEAGWHVLGLA